MYLLSLERGLSLRDVATGRPRRFRLRSRLHDEIDAIGAEPEQRNVRRLAGIIHAYAFHGKDVRTLIEAEGCEFLRICKAARYAGQ